MNTVASLPAKWRAKSSEIAKPYGFVTELVLGKAHALEHCADELEAALASPAPSAPVVDDAERGAFYVCPTCKGPGVVTKETHDAALSGVSANVGVEAMRKVFNGINRYTENGEQPGMATLKHWETLLHRALANPAAAPRVECECKPSAVGGMVPGCKKCCSATPAASEDGLEDRVNALYDELFCTGKHLHAKVPIDPKAIIRRALATAEQAQPEARGVEDGDYVLATKYADGDPGDQWAVGFYDGQRGGRHYVIDAHGSQFRGNGFRRVQRIEAPQGRYLFDRRTEIEASGRSLWDWLAATPNPVRAEQQECGAIGSQGCTYRPEGPHGEMQCTYCGAEQPEGKWKLVPVEPTQEMRAAGREAHYEAETLANEQWDAGKAGMSWRENRAAHVYAAMLAAAPAAPGAAVGVDAEWFADVRRCLQDVSTEMRARGRGDERFQRLIQRMPAALAGKAQEESNG